MTLHIERYGAGQPLVLIHGWAMHTGMWRLFVQQLAQHYQVICVDLPGHGLSDSVEPYNLSTLAECILQSLDIEHFHVLGWSLGGAVALAMAEKASERVDSVVLLSANPCFVEKPDWSGVNSDVLMQFASHLQQDCPATLIRFLALQVNGLENGKVLLKQLKNAVQECPPPNKTVLQAGLKILADEDLREVLSRIQIPVLTLLGNKDSLIPVEVADKIQAIQPSCQIQIIDKAGHVAFLSHTEQVIASIRDFI